MADIAAIASILGSVKTATEIAKLLKDSDLSLEKAEMKLKLADLISALADARIETAEIQSLIAEKDEKIKQLKETLETNKNVKYDKPYYWLGEGSEREGPYCQHCFDKDGKLIRLQGYGSGYWDCKVCKNNYTDSSYIESGAVVVGPATDWSDY
jgi:hypothetical protein